MPIQHENRSGPDWADADLRTASGVPNWKAWVLRPMVLFPAAYTMVGVLHELAHAATAFALGVPSTLFHLYVHLDPANGTLNERAAIRAAGPVFCLGVGLVAAFVFRRARGSRVDLPLLYLAWFGIGTFFGNLMGTPFVGDFSSMAIAFEAPMTVRYGLALVGLLSICGFSFFLGTELRKWSPLGVSATHAMIGMIVLPAIIGTASGLLIFQPMSSDWVPARLGESAFWIFAAVGTLISGKQPAGSGRDLGVGWPDIALLLTAILVVRLFAGGIEFIP